MKKNINLFIGKSYGGCSIRHLVFRPGRRQPALLLLLLRSSSCSCSSEAPPAPAPQKLLLLLLLRSSSCSCSSEAPPAPQKLLLLLRSSSCSCPQSALTTIERFFHSFLRDRISKSTTFFVRSVWTQKNLLPDDKRFKRFKIRLFSVSGERAMLAGDRPLSLWMYHFDFHADFHQARRNNLV